MKEEYVVSYRSRQNKYSNWKYVLAKVSIDMETEAKEVIARKIRRHYAVYQVEILDSMPVRIFVGTIGTIT